jgi:hypothetical protein
MNKTKAAELLSKEFPNCIIEDLDYKFNSHGNIYYENTVFRASSLRKENIHNYSYLICFENFKNIGPPNPLLESEVNQYLYDLKDKQTKNGYEGFAAIFFKYDEKGNCDILKGMSRFFYYE